MELLDPQVFGLIEKIFGAAAASDFMRTLAIFSAAAWVHSWGVRKEIKKQIGELITVFRDDHDKGKKQMDVLGGRVTRLETYLSIKRGE